MKQARPIYVVSTLTLFAFFVHGYHPDGEDGGLYLAGIKKLLNPALYPYWTAFVTEHLRFSFFAAFVATLVRATHLGLEPVLLILYLAGIWTTLYAGWMLLARTNANELGCTGGVALLACWLDLPIAGTSQMLMDPYVTARTLTTPLTLFAAAWALDWTRERRHGWLCIATLAPAAALHPLMAGYAIAVVVVILGTASRKPRIRTAAPWFLLALALLGATALQLRAPAECPNYVWVAMTRYYWFPFRWQWYEQLGLVAPLVLIYVLDRASHRVTHDRRSEAKVSVGAIPSSTGQRVGRDILTHSSLVLAGIALTVAVLFSRAHLATHLVARMQPLRAYGFIYEVMTLLLGAWLGECVLARKPWHWALLLAGLGASMFFVQRSTYPASAHLELPGRSARNPWVQAFLWARANTPQDALFALDANYITRDGEDAQSFRALAERSALPDYSKDGGEASITPSLTSAWVQGQAAQTGLEHASDVERAERLLPMGVTWAVLQTSSTTQWLCPYRNTTVKVCRLPEAYLTRPGF